MSDNETVSEYNFVFPRKLIMKFLKLYKESPCLWDRNDSLYKHKKKRHEAITKLTELVQEYDPNTSRVHVLRKIESMRACVRREYNKVANSRKTATCPEDVHTPHLWYYDLLSFVFEEQDGGGFTLRTDKSPVLTLPNVVKSEEFICDDDIIEESDEEVADEDTSGYEVSMEPFPVEYSNASNMVDSEASMSKQYSPYDREDDQKSKRQRTEVTDEYDAIGINVAAKLRYLPPNMRILAEKLINDVLFQAQMNALNSSTALTTSDPFKQEQTII